RSQTVALGTQVKYLHVAAVDKAGNVGGTVHIRIDAKDIEWKLYTEQLVMEEAENVYPAGESKTWYVRADGETPFTMQNRSYMDGIATESYQPNYIIYESVLHDVTAQNIIYVPPTAIRSGTIRMDAEELSHSSEGQSMLVQYPYSYAVRSDSNKKLLGVQAFTLSPETSGKRIEIIPIAGADKGTEIIYSNHNIDRGNHIIIIGDGEAPIITGLDVLENTELINRNEGSFILCVNAMDAISGIREFYLEITNTDNGNSQRYFPDSQSCIQIEITQDEPIFSGDFTVRAYAVDYVGNETEVTCATTEFALTASLERILEPHAPIFKCGESGILTLSTYGYAEKVEVIFPPEMTTLQPDLNRTFDYSGSPSYRQQEEIQFMIPLYTPANAQYTITVIAYKGEKRLEEHPTFSTIAVNGSVLDEVRTRLR
uniref:hypothetical protein n=1 Tax=Acetatifactor sp. TaxID=1872090 RepID=UPI0040571D0F